MDAFLDDIIPLLIRLGPPVLFLVTMAETALFLGLLIPAEATVLLAGFLAFRGVFGLQEVLAATILGGLVGDQAGYLLGRHGGTRWAARQGRMGQLWRRHERRAKRLFRRHSVFAVTLARFVSFVRTLTPWFAGMAALPYGRFLFYDLLGVVGWGVASVAAGYLAGESWDIVAGAIGSVMAVIVFVLLGFVALAGWRGRRRARQQQREAGNGAGSLRTPTAGSTDG